MAIVCGASLLHCKCGSTDLTHRREWHDPDVPNRSAWWGQCQTCGAETFIPDLVNMRHLWPLTPTQ